jgi:hypothetical protein
MLTAVQNLIMTTFGRLGLNSEDDSRVCDDFIRNYSAAHSHLMKEDMLRHISYSQLTILGQLLNPNGRKFPNRMGNFILGQSVSTIFLIIGIESKTVLSTGDDRVHSLIDIVGLDRPTAQFKFGLLAKKRHSVSMLMTTTTHTPNTEQFIHKSPVSPLDIH